MKKIVMHICESYDGGSKSFIDDISRKITDYEHCLVYGLRGKGKVEDHVSSYYVKEMTSGINLFSDLKSILKIVKIIRSVRPDIVHCHSSKGGAVGRVAAAISFRSRSVIYTPHCISFMRLDISKYAKSFFIAVEFFLQFLSNKVIACSEAEKMEMDRYYIKRSHLILNGVKNKIYGSAPSRSHMIVGIGRTDAQKNPDLFSEIALGCSSLRSELKFIWLGGRKEYIEGAHVNWLGGVEREEVAEILREARLFLSTSSWEGLSLATLEAMSLGLPICVSKTKGNSELVDGNGLSFESSREAIEFITSTTDESLEIMGHRSAELQREKYDIENMISEYVKIYEEIR